MALILLEDTYVTLADADAMLLGNPEWDTADVDTKEKALKDATFKLDENNWLGTAKSGAQPLSWPRTTFSYFDKSKNLNIQVEDSSVPQRLERATARLALHFIKFPSSISGYEAEFDRIKLGPLELENTDVRSDKTRPPIVPYKDVYLHIEPLLQTDGVIGRLSWWKAN